MIRENKSVTLLELMVSISLIGIMALMINGVGSSVYTIKRDILDREQPMINGSTATSFIFERLLRADGVGSAAAFQIYDAGTRVNYTRLSNPEQIWLDGSNIKYRMTEGGAVTLEKVILRDVSSLQFSQDYGNRLAVGITLTDNKFFRVAVQPRGGTYCPECQIN